MERLTVSMYGCVFYNDDETGLKLEPCEIDPHRVRLLLEALEKYEDTGLTTEEMQELAEQIRRIKAIFGDSIEIPKIVEFLVDFHIAQAAADNAGADEPLTNEDVLKWQELKERDTAKKIRYIRQEFPEHQWRRTESGEIDTFAMSYEYHNGPMCERCGYSFCEHCEPDGYDEEPCVIDEYRCPTCNGEEIGRSDKYCKHCGQRLKWEE